MVVRLFEVILCVMVCVFDGLVFSWCKMLCVIRVEVVIFISNVSVIVVSIMFCS